jgi:hypothetical protein
VTIVPNRNLVSIREALPNHSTRTRLHHGMPAAVVDFLKVEEVEGADTVPVAAGGADGAGGSSSAVPRTAAGSSP